MGGKVMPRPSHIPPGQWGTQIVFWSPITKKGRDQDGDETEDRCFAMRAYTVFDVDQVEGDHLDHLRSGMADTGETLSPCPSGKYVGDLPTDDVLVEMGNEGLGGGDRSE